MHWASSVAPDTSLHPLATVASCGVVAEEERSLWSCTAVTGCLLASWLVSIPTSTMPLWLVGSVGLTDLMVAVAGHAKTCSRLTCAESPARPRVHASMVTLIHWFRVSVLDCGMS